MARLLDGKHGFPKATDDQAAEMTIDRDESTLATGMIEVHGAEAAAVARGNARDAALAGQPMQARSWIRVLSLIQRRRAGNRPAAASGGPPPA